MLDDDRQEEKQQSLLRAPARAAAKRGRDKYLFLTDPGDYGTQNGETSSLKKWAFQIGNFLFWAGVFALTAVVFALLINVGKLPNVLSIAAWIGAALGGVFALIRQSRKHHEMASDSASVILNQQTYLYTRLSSLTLLFFAPALLKHPLLARIVNVLLWSGVFFGLGFSGLSSLGSRLGVSLGLSAGILTAPLLFASIAAICAITGQLLGGNTSGDKGKQARRGHAYVGAFVHDLLFSPHGYIERLTWPISPLIRLFNIALWAGLAVLLAVATGIQSNMALSLIAIVASVFAAAGQRWATQEEAPTTPYAKSWSLTKLLFMPGLLYSDKLLVNSVIRLVNVLLWTAPFFVLGSSGFMNGQILSLFNTLGLSELSGSIVQMFGKFAAPIALASIAGFCAIIGQVVGGMNQGGSPRERAYVLGAVVRDLLFSPGHYIKQNPHFSLAMKICVHGLNLLIWMALSSGVFLVMGGLEPSGALLFGSSTAGILALAWHFIVWNIKDGVDNPNEKLEFEPAFDLAQPNARARASAVEAPRDLLAESKHAEPIIEPKPEPDVALNASFRKWFSCPLLEKSNNQSVYRAGLFHCLPAAPRESDAALEEVAAQGWRGERMSRATPQRIREDMERRGITTVSPPGEELLFDEMGYS